MKPEPTVLANVVVSGKISNDSRSVSLSVDPVKMFNFGKLEE